MATPAGTPVGNLVSHWVGDASGWITAINKGVAASVSGAAAVGSALSGAGGSATKGFSKLFGESLGGGGAMNALAVMHVVHATEELGQKIYEDNADIKALNASLEMTKEISKQVGEAIGRIAQHKIADIGIAPKPEQAKAAVDNLNEQQLRVDAARKSYEHLRDAYKKDTEGIKQNASEWNLWAQAKQAYHNTVNGADQKTREQEVNSAEEILKAQRKATTEAQEKVRAMKSELIGASNAWLDQAQNVDKSKRAIADENAELNMQAGILGETELAQMKLDHAKAEGIEQVHKLRDLRDAMQDMVQPTNEAAKALRDYLRQGGDPLSQYASNLRTASESMKQIQYLTQLANKDMGAAKGIAEQSLSPGENYKKQIKDINNAMDSGLFGAGQTALDRRNKAVKKADEQLIEQVKADHKELQYELSGLGGTAGNDRKSADFAAKLQGLNFAGQQQRAFGELLKNARNTPTDQAGHIFNDPSRVNETALKETFITMEGQQAGIVVNTKNTNDLLTKILAAIPGNGQQVTLSPANL